MLYCDIDWWDKSIEKGDVIDYRYLTSITIRKRFVLITYIAQFPAKSKKGKPCEMDMPLLQNDITRYFWK